MTYQPNHNGPAATHTTLPTQLWREAVGPGYQASGVAIKGLEQAIWPGSIRLQRFRISGIA